ncbi:MAG: hypothetical protein JW807_08475 [Spirochaetes bacterium]|nr:hypothetical protein [Spirochaetota bacterium]
MSASNTSSSKKPVWERIKKKALFISFSNPDLERQFLTRQMRDNLNFNRMVVIAGFAAYSGFYLMNYYLMPPADIMLYAVPYATAATAFATIFIVSFMDLPHYVFYPWATASILVGNIAPLVSVMNYQFPQTYFFHSACILLVTTSLIFIRLEFYYMVVFSALYLISFEVLYFLIGPHTAAETLNIHYILAAAIGVGLVINFNIEKRERTNFVKLRIIVENRTKLSMLRDARPGRGKKEG